MSVRRWHIAVFLIALLVFAVARAPVSLIAPQREGAFTYARAQGTIWRGHLESVRFGAFDGGAIEWRMSLLELLRGALAANVTLAGGDIIGDVRARATLGGERRVSADNLLIRGAKIAPNLALGGETNVRGLDILFEHGACRTAAGEISSSVLAEGAGALGWRGPPLAGEASCAGDEAQIALSGAADAETVRVDLMFRANGAGRWRAEARTAKPELEAVLAAAGFAPAPADASVMTREAAWAPF